MSMPTIAVVIDPAITAKADAVLKMIHGSMSALNFVYFGFSSLARKN